MKEKNVQKQMLTESTINSCFRSTWSSVKEPALTASWSFDALAWNPGICFRYALVLASGEYSPTRRDPSPFSTNCSRDGISPFLSHCLICPEDVMLDTPPVDPLKVKAEKRKTIKY